MLDEDEADDDVDEHESEPYHPVDREIEVSHAYADPQRFDDDDITDRLHHYLALQRQAFLLEARQRPLLDRVVERITFEFVRRMEEEFAPKPGDDEYLEPYENPDLIDRDFEDPMDA